MKKLLTIMVLGLLLSGNANAEVLHLKCLYTNKTQYTAWDGVLKKEVSDIDPVFEMVYSFDLDKEKMIGKNYKIWKEGTGEFKVLVLEDKIIWLDPRLLKEDKRPLFMDIFGQTALTTYVYNEINRYDGTIELSFYSQQWTIGKKLNDLNVFDLSEEDLKYVKEINKLAKSDRNQKDNILVSTDTGKCEKLKKLEKKF
ncbi:hypothetical protein N9Y98_03115 [Candidatus Pelagibacter bacterium]|nr:hypothetical protein [Candidatus Pelagibacter bacterium]